MTITVGQEAPDFELPNQFGEKVSLSSFRGKKNVVVVFLVLGKVVISYMINII